MLQIAGPLTQTSDLGLTLDVIAECGPDSLVYSIDAGTLAPGEIAAVDLSDLAAVGQWKWIGYRAHLFVRVTLSDPEVGTTLMMVGAPERWLGWDGRTLSLVSSEDQQTNTLGADGEAEVVIEVPPVVVATREVK